MCQQKNPGNASVRPILSGVTPCRKGYSRFAKSYVHGYAHRHGATVAEDIEDSGTTESGRPKVRHLLRSPFIRHRLPLCLDITQR